MRIPKKYGISKIDKCPFCDKTATTMNFQDVPVCQKHKNEEMPAFKCQCNSYLDIKSGKYGIFFNCLDCGNMNFSKAMELNEDLMKEHINSISNNNNNNNNNKIENSNNIKKNTINKPKSNWNNKGAKNKSNKSNNNETTITSDMIDAYYS